MAENLLRKSLSIGFEWAILEEATQVIDELQIMQEIYLQQIKVMGELGKVLKKASDRADKAVGKASGDGASAEGTSGEEVVDGRRKAMERIESIMSDMTQRHDELRSMEKLQHKTRQQVGYQDLHGPHSNWLAAVNADELAPSFVNSST